MISALFEKVQKRSLLHGTAVFMIVLSLASPLLSGEPSRKIGLALTPGYYVLDGDYFGLKDAPEIEFCLRYELLWHTYFENRIGAMKSKGDGVSVGGFTYQLGLLTIFPYFIPYRPLARVGIGFISVDPITVTPTDTFRPSQSTFYFIVGGGGSRSIRENITVETSADIWFTPYRYRIYRFDRQSVDAQQKQFTHFKFNIGISYIF